MRTRSLPKLRKNSRRLLPKKEPRKPSRAVKTSTMSEFAITPATVTATAGQPLTFHVTNKGAMPHDFSVNGTEGTKMLEPGESEMLEVEAIDVAERDTFVARCRDHRRIQQ